MSLTSSEVVSSFRIFWNSLVIMVLVYGICVLISSMTGNINPFQPFKTNLFYSSESIAFAPIADMQQLNEALSQAKFSKKPVMLLFSAEWCKSCKDLHENILTDVTIKNKMHAFTLLKVDLTNQGSPAYDIARKYNIAGAPSILFFNASGELTNDQINGIVNASSLQNILSKLSR